MKTIAAAFGLLLLTSLSHADQSDWAEGTRGRFDGATRDYYNRAGLLRWTHRLGDWRDAENAPQGKAPYATVSLVDDDKEKFVEWDVTNLVREWIEGKHRNQGMFLRAVKGGGTFHFRSREHSDPDQRPALVVTTSADTLRRSPTADTYLEPSTYRSQGHADVLKVAGTSAPALLRFDLAGVEDVTRAVLKLYTFRQYSSGATEIGVFRCAQGHDLPPSAPIAGLAARYPGDQGILDDPDVIFFAGFETEKWADAWTYVGGKLEPVTADGDRKFKGFRGKALRIRIAEGSTGAMNVGYKFRKQTGAEPEEIYFRYYLRLADDWNQTRQGGKMPGISGTYGRAGWGGRKSDGRNGWSARGSFYYSIPEGNPLAGTHPIGTYCYHADMRGRYGDIWIWQKGYRGFLRKNRWYSVEQYLKLNTPGEKNGVLRAWIDGRLAFEKKDIRFRLVDTLRIEQIWMNVYHGGTVPSPRDQHCYIDNVVIANKYIGPMKPD